MSDPNRKTVAIPSHKWTQVGHFEVYQCDGHTRYVTISPEGTLGTGNYGASWRIRIVDEDEDQ